MPVDTPGQKLDNQQAHKVRPSREANAPVSFLDDTWSWSSPSTWPLSIRLLPVPIACIVLFFGVYIQHFLYAPSQHESCMADFDYGIPIEKIEKLATSLARHDWEQGAAAEALLELYDPRFSVFASEPFPGGKVPGEGAEGTRALMFVLPEIRLGGDKLSNNTWGVSDPASLGVYPILAAADSEKTQQGNEYKQAVDRQASYLTTVAPRYANGATSHRATVAELWSDAIFMFPPFLAYHAIYSSRSPSATAGKLQQTVEQIKLYRDVLIITEGANRGAWRHIVGPSEMADPGAWSTGNGWAAYGMVRVRATLAGWSQGTARLQREIASLDSWVAEIIDAAIRTDDHESGLLRNYLGDDTWFGEMAGTALVAAAAYRLASFLGTDSVRRGSYITWADKKRDAVFAHVDTDGVAKPAVNSLKHAQREPLNGPNPEGESFLLLLAAAWRDCVCNGICSR